MEKDIKRVLLDARNRDRYLSQNILTDTVLNEYLSSLEDLSEQISSFEDKQPALGLFDEETLKRIQKNFPYSV